VYYPYLRGKQFELSALRELAPVLAEGRVVPIIEPVRTRENSLVRTLSVLDELHAHNVIILNPQVGDFTKKQADLAVILKKHGLLTLEYTRKGIIIASDEDLAFAQRTFDRYANDNFLLVLERTRLEGLAEFLSSNDDRIDRVVCDEQKTRTLRRKLHVGRGKIIIREDGFQKEDRNSDYSPVSEFSDVHLIWQEDELGGFSDYLTIGNIYSESGGPAYTVAIHLTAHTGEDELEVRHFKSEDSKTYLDTAGKFHEALEKLNPVNTDQGLFLSSALMEYQSLYTSGHFPGLGYVKKLSIKHHIELINEWLKSLD